ncbi:MAG: TrmH family RNA methyltransferase [Sandaracinaceae bacterium]
MPRPTDAKFYGLHACEALAERRPEDVQRAFFTREMAPRFGALTSAMAKRRRPYRVVEEDELATVAGSRHHEGVCLVAEPIPSPSFERWLADASGPTRAIFLDGVDNPHNVGLVLRSAAHFGGGALICWTRDLERVDGASARVAEGGAERVPIVFVEDPREALEAMREAGFALIATVVREAPSLYAEPLPDKVVFLLGSEGEGVGESAVEIADRAVTIPGTGAVDSLNVAAACAVLLSEHARQFPSPGARSFGAQDP